MLNARASDFSRKDIIISINLIYEKIKRVNISRVLFLFVLY